MTRLVEYWRAFWFPPLSAGAFAAYRAVFFGLVLLMITVRSRYPLWWWSEVDDIFWMPIPLTEALGVAPPAEGVLFAVDLTFKLSLAAVFVGLWTRGSPWIAFLSGAVFFWLPHNFGKVHHGDALVLFFLLFFALAPSPDRFTLRSWLLRRRGRAVGAVADDPAYGATLRLMQVLMMLVFFSAGVAKLNVAGLEWALSDNLRHLLLRHHISHEPLVDWGLWIAGYPLLCQVGAVMTIVLEVGAPLMFVHRFLRVVFAVGLFGFQLANWLLLGVPFALFMCCYVCWLPWERIAERLHREEGRMAA